ncbi:MAG: InlB B-repeat-containing protein [Treponema sp.]|nr:InlB B-repeat-containing protein [Treponema sp.]
MRKLFVFFIVFSLGLIVTSCNLEVTKHCRVIYDGNGITGGERPVDTNNYTPGQTAIVLENTYEKTGFTFKHWNTHWLGTGESYNPGETLEIGDHYFIHLYAIWE